jgi:hypothetical protein
MVKRNPRRKIEQEERIHPDFFYRYADGPKFFGYGLTTLAERIKSGDEDADLLKRRNVPRPVHLADGGRAKGWFGRTIIEWQAEQMAKAPEREARARAERAKAKDQKQKPTQKKMKQPTKEDGDDRAPRR